MLCTTEVGEEEKWSLDTRRNILQVKMDDNDNEDDDDNLQFQEKGGESGAFLSTAGRSAFLLLSPRSFVVDGGEFLFDDEGVTRAGGDGRFFGRRPEIERLWRGLWRGWWIPPTTTGVVHSGLQGSKVGVLVVLLLQVTGVVVVVLDGGHLLVVLS